MNRWLIWLSGIVGCLGLLAGCATQKTDPCHSFLTDPPLEQGIKMNSVNIIDRSLRSDSVWATYCSGQRVAPPPGGPPPAVISRYKITVQKHASRKSPTGTMEVWATLKNHTDYPLQIEGRTQFFDKDESPTDVGSTWQRVQLPPKGIGTFRDFSTRLQGVESYYIELREGR